MTILSWLLLAPALACDEASSDVLSATPDHGAVGVPLDARVVLRVRGAGAVAPNTMELAGPHGRVPGQWASEALAGGTDALWTFTPDAPLAPEATYELGAVLPPSADYTEGWTWTAGFSTGASLADVPDGVPTVALLDVGQAMDGQMSRCEPDHFRRVIYAAEPADVARPAEAWFLLWVEEAGHRELLEARRLDSRRWDGEAEVLVPTAGGAFCLEGEVRSSSGDSAFSEPACFRPPSPADGSDVAYTGGAACGHAPSGGFGLAWGLGALLVVRRRARCA